MTKKIIIISSFVLIFILPASVFSSDTCPENKIQEAKQSCQRILFDIEGTLKLAKRVEKKAQDKILKAAKPGYECLKGGAETLSSAFTYCNPNSPLINIAKCAETIVSIPSVYKSCEEATILVIASISLYRQSSTIIGAANVAFSDQGGDEVMAYLKSCDIYTCEQQKGTLDQNINKALEKNSQAIQKAEKMIENFQSMEDKLKACEADKSHCSIGVVLP